MKKLINAALSIFIILITAFLLTNCKKEEIVIVYSKIKTVGTSNITSTSARVEGEIEELTETTHGEYGVCWSTSNEPTVYDEKSLVDGVASVGSFFVSLTGLDPSTTYYVRAFVLDKKKNIYGDNLTFTTSAAILPTVSTKSVSDITSVYAVSGGNVTKQGDKPVIARGVCFDTIASPTILKNKTIDGWSTGSFESRLTNLKPSKKYYVRAYAISEFGVSYGNQVSFTTDNPVYSFFDDFDDNSNGWSINSDTYGSYEITGGEYVCTYHREGYLRRTWSNLTDFPGMANSKDFVLEAEFKNLSYDTKPPLSADYTAGLIWDCGNSGFKYFSVRKNVDIYPSLSTTYYYKIGSYNGSYTTWKDYTQFSGSNYNKLTIKKGNGYYYFFVNDVQVHKQSYSNVTEEGIGFLIESAKMHADYLSIEQKGDKKSSTDVLIELIPDSPGKQDVIRSPGKQ